MTADNLEALSDFSAQPSTTLPASASQDGAPALDDALENDREKEQWKANLGATFFPPLGKLGLHPLQMCVEEPTRKRLFDPIHENRDSPKMDFVKQLDTCHASKLLGYAKMIEELVI